MPYLEVVEGVSLGQVVTVTEKVMLGRSPSNNFCIPDSRASRTHASIHYDGTNCTICDLGSANGTYINAAPLQPNTPYMLNENDEIGICATRIKFHVANELPASSKNKIPGTSSAMLMPKIGSPLAVVMTEDETAPAVNATMDASISFAQMPEPENESTEQLKAALKRLQAMVQVSVNLGTVTDKEPLLEKIMDSIFDVFPNADRAFIMLPLGEKRQMTPVVGRNRGENTSGDDDFAVSRTIISNVVDNKQSILSSDALTDDRFGAQQSIVDLQIRSMMCAPFICQDEILGIISVDTKNSLQAFDADDLAMLTGIASQAAIAIKNADLYVEVEDEAEKRATLSRYLSPDVVNGVVDGTIPLELGGKNANGTVFFCDILGFTAMSESLSAVEVIDKLNRYFRLTTEAITGNRGTVHKFAGDAVMAFWNVMFPDPEHEHNSIVAALCMQTAVWGFDLFLESIDQKPIYLGIGCNTGEFAAGNVGGQRVMEYTIIGDNVNLTQRIESQAGRWQVLVSQKTYTPVKEKTIAVGLPPVMVKGKSMPIKIFSIRGILVDDDKMKLDIPVKLLGTDKKVFGRGMLDSATGLNSDLQLDMLTDGELTPDMPVILEFEMPELTEKFIIGGKVKSTTEATYEGAVTYSKVVLGDIRGNDAVKDFLTPGSIIESDKDWDQMRRE